MGYEGRSEFFPYLKEKLGDVPFLIDPLKGAEGHLGVWGNCRRAWLAHDPKADYHVVIQDDAIVCKDFKKRAEEFITKHHKDGENRVFNFYFGNKRALRDQAVEGMKKGFTIKNRPSWGVAICMPTKLIKDMIEKCDDYHNSQDDVRIGKYIVLRGLNIYYPLPSLIDHRVADEAESLVGDPGRHRQAWFYIDDKKRNTLKV